MTNGEMKAEVRRMLGNMQASDPFIAAGDHQKWVNRGITDVVLMGLQGLKVGIDLFPELRCSWTSDLTINGINQQSLPADKLLITGIGSFDSSALPNQNLTHANPVTYKPPETFDLISKDATRTGYPRIWTMIGRSFKYYPTPSVAPTDYTTYMLLWGIETDPYPDMSADADQPKILPVWHDACVYRAAANGARARGWFDRAEEWDNAAKMKLGFSTDIGATEDMAHRGQLDLSDLLNDRMANYGS